MPVAMKVDRKTGEPILMEFGASLPRTLPPYDVPYGANFDLLLEKLPWRSLFFGLFLFAALLAVFGPEGGLVALPMLAILIVLEAWNRRDFATPLRIVSQFGILGTGRVEIPLEEVERVEFTVYSRFRRELGFGSVTVFGDRKALRFSWILAPAAIAQHILDLKHRNEVRNEIAASEKTGKAPPEPVDANAL